MARLFITTINCSHDLLFLHHNLLILIIRLIVGSVGLVGGRDDYFVCKTLKLVVPWYSNYPNN